MLQMHNARAILARRIGHSRLIARGRLIQALHDPTTDPKHVPIQSIATTTDGTRFQIDTGSAIEWAIWTFGAYEPELQTRIRQFMASGEVFVDIGANIGVHSCCVARQLGPASKVIAVEPTSTLAGRLRRNVDLNALENVIVVEAAAGSRDGDIVFYPPRSDEPNQMLGSLTRGPKLDAGGVTVDLHTVDTIVREATGQPVKVLKIDVEGHELDVLQGARDVLLQDRPIVFFEHSVGSGGNELQMAERLVQTNKYLASVNYDIVGSVGHGTRMLIAKSRKLATAP